MTTVIRYMGHGGRTWDFMRLSLNRGRILSGVTATCFLRKCKILLTYKLCEKRCLFGLLVRYCSGSVPCSAALRKVNEQVNKRIVVCKPKSHGFVNLLKVNLTFDF